MTSSLPAGSCAPVALFVYNRPDHTRQTLEALQANTLATETPLYIFVDAPRDAGARAGHAAVLECVRDVQGFASVTLIRRESNLGLARSIIDGVKRLTDDYGRVIVLEDDLVTASGFLAFMNQALDTYAGAQEILSICGYMYPVSFNGTPDTFFLRAPHSWGWATWKDRWSLFRHDGAELLRELETRGLLAEFDANGPHDYTRMLKAQIAGRNDSWFIRWYASSLLADRMSLYPARSLVRNIGIDGTGVHCAEWRFDPYAVTLHEAPLHVEAQDPLESTAAKTTLKRYYRQVRLSRYLNFAYRKMSALKRLLRLPASPGRGTER